MKRNTIGLLVLSAMISACGAPTVEKDGGKKVYDHISSNIDSMREDMLAKLKEQRQDYKQYNEQLEMQFDRILTEGKYSTPIVIGDSAKEFFANPNPATDCRFVFAFGWSIYCYAEVDLLKKLEDVNFTAECLDASGKKVGDDKAQVSINDNAIVNKKIEFQISSVQSCWNENGTQMRIEKK